MNKRRLQENIKGYSFVMPALIATLVFVIYPMIMSAYYSLTDFNGLKAPVWIGLQNYIDMFKDEGVLRSLKNTVMYAVISVPIQVTISLTLAALIAYNFQNLFGNFVRSTLFVPVICSATVAATVWYIFFLSDADSMVNQFIALFGHERVDWLGQKGTAFFAVTFVNIWKGIGYYMVIFYAGIMDIPRNLYEAATIDGATGLQKFFHITLPNLKSITATVITLCSISAFKVFEMVNVMTGGGPAYATSTLVMRVRKEGFEQWDMGYACAISILLMAIIMTVTLVERRLMKEEE